VWKLLATMLLQLQYVNDSKSSRRLAAVEEQEDIPIDAATCCVNKTPNEVNASPKKLSGLAKKAPTLDRNLPPVRKSVWKKFQQSKN